MSKSRELEAIRIHSRRFLNNSPTIRDMFLEYYETSYKPGKLDTRTKRLMALCGGLVAGCTGCILGQADMALQEGATVEEILETCAVAMSLGGTLVWSRIAMAMEFLEENGLPD